MANIKPFSSLSSIRAMFQWTQAAPPSKLHTYIAFFFSCSHSLLASWWTPHSPGIPIPGSPLQLRLHFPNVIQWPPKASCRESDATVPCLASVTISTQPPRDPHPSSLRACKTSCHVCSTATLVDRLRRGLASVDHCYSDFCVPWRLTLGETLPKLAILG